MERTEILSKETLLCYLLNELSSGNYEVETHLDNEGCWLGEITIRTTNETINEDQEYFHELAKNMLRRDDAERTRPMFRQSDFSFERDEVIFSECTKCGDYEISPREEKNNCSYCGGRMIHETAHEGVACSLCWQRFNPFDVAYRGKNANLIICEKCYKTLDN